jgi:hypothetical protein
MFTSKPELKPVFYKPGFSRVNWINFHLQPSISLQVTLKLLGESLGFGIHQLGIPFVISLADMLVSQSPQPVL